MRQVLLLAGCVLFLVGCDKKDDDKEREIGVPGQVRVVMSNDTGAALSDMAPTFFGQKIAYVSLRGTMTEADGAVHAAEAIVWGNPACKFDKMQVLHPHSDKPEDIEVLFEYYSTSEICRNVGDYIDFSQGSTAVNAALNAQDYPVPPGTWDRVALNSVVNADGAPLWLFQAGNMTSPVEVYGDGAGGGAETLLASPIVIAAGDSVTVSVSYDLSSTVGYGPVGASPASGGSKCHTDTASSVEYCVNHMLITPAAAKDQ